MNSTKLDFDGDALKLVESAYEQASDYQYSINEQFKRDYLLYIAYLDMANRDDNLPNIALPKIFATVEQKVAQDLKYLFATSPYIPLESKREDYRYLSKIQEELLDGYLERGNFYNHCIPLFKLKTIGGVAFMDVMPTFTRRTETQMIPTPLGMQPMTQEVTRFGLKFTHYAPWQIFVDPFAKNLEEVDGCRYVVKMMLTSKRAIKNIHARGGYSDLDIDKLDHAEGGKAYQMDDWGKLILNDLGLEMPEGDDDIGVLLRYESSERYIDVWNGTVPLRDIDNPFIGQGQKRGHGRINLIRCPHIYDPHTMKQIWGIGECKINEVQATMLNDMWGNVFRREQLAGEPVIFYKKDAIDPDSMVMETGNRIAVNSDIGRPLSDSVVIHTGSEMPKDQFNLISMIERNIDLTSGQYGSQRGEISRTDITAREIDEISSRGSERQELIVKTAEDVFLKGVADLSLGCINQFATMDDYVDILGMEKASQMFTATPYDIPGGFDFRFKGSARVTNQLIKQRNLKELAPQLAQLFGAGQFAMAKLLMESHEIPENEIDVIMRENYMRMQMQMQMSMIQAQGQAQIEAKGTQPGGKYKENNQQQVSKENRKAVKGN